MFSKMHKSETKIKDTPWLPKSEDISKLSDQEYPYLKTYRVKKQDNPSLMIYSSQGQTMRKFRE